MFIAYYTIHCYEYGPFFCDDVITASGRHSWHYLSAGSFHHTQ